MKTKYIVFASILGFAHCNAQSPEQIEAFKETIQSTWSADSNNDFDGLTCMDEIVPDLKPYVSARWVALKKNLKNGRIEVLEYVPKEEMERRIEQKHEDSESYAQALKTMNQPIARGDQFMIQNLTVVGVMKIKVVGDDDSLTMFNPVGVKDGKLLFPGVKAMKKGEQAGASDGESAPN